MMRSLRRWVAAAIFPEAFSPLTYGMCSITPRLAAGPSPTVASCQSDPARFLRNADILSLASTFAAKREIKLSSLGVYAANDGKLFLRLIEGRTMTLRSSEKLLSWFSENWPSDLDWPADIPRPERPVKLG